MGLNSRAPLNLIPSTDKKRRKYLVPIHPSTHPQRVPMNSSFLDLCGFLIPLFTGATLFSFISDFVHCYIATGSCLCLGPTSQLVFPFAMSSFPISPFKFHPPPAFLVL